MDGHISTKIQQCWRKHFTVYLTSARVEEYNLSRGHYGEKGAVCRAKKIFEIIVVNIMYMLIGKKSARCTNIRFHIRWEESKHIQIV